MAAFSSRGGGFLVEEHAVHAVAYAELLLERLDMDIAGALLDGLGDHGVDQADDRRLAGHVAQVLEIGGGLFVIALARGDLALGLAVMLLQGVQDLRFGSQRGANFQSGERAHRRDGLEIQRIGHRQRQRGIGQGQGKDAALAQKALRETLDFGGRGRRLVHRHDGNAELVGKRRQHVALGDQAHIDQDLAELLAALLLQFEGALQIFRLDLVALDQNLAEPHRARASRREAGRRGGIGHRRGALLVFRRLDLAGLGVLARWPS